MALFQDLNREGKTVVIVTHEHDIANHRKRIVRFKDGFIVDDERVTEVIDARDMLAKMPDLDAVEVRKPKATASAPQPEPGFQV